jgi:hypothetical protein
LHEESEVRSEDGGALLSRNLLDHLIKRHGSDAMRNAIQRFAESGVLEIIDPPIGRGAQYFGVVRKLCDVPDEWVEEEV